MLLRGGSPFTSSDIVVCCCGIVLGCCIVVRHVMLGHVVDAGLQRFSKQHPTSPCWVFLSRKYMCEGLHCFLLSLLH